MINYFQDTVVFGEHNIDIKWLDDLPPFQVKILAHTIANRIREKAAKTKGN